MSSNVEKSASVSASGFTPNTVANFACSKCDYVCGSKRVLSAHDSAAHSDKVYQCPRCPFVSRYQANFYRHRRIVHKIGRTTCNVCNFDCQSIDDLIQHKELDHGQGLEDVLRRYEKDKEDKKRESDDYVNFDEEERERLKKAEALYFSGYGYQALLDRSQEPINYSIKDGPNAEALERPSTSTSLLTQPAADMAQRSPLKVKRHYTCKDCSMQTLDPREFLYHRKEIHYDRITVQECPYCIYATKHFQKLQRHCGLVHKNHPKLTIKPSDASPYQSTQSALAAKRSRKSTPNRASPPKTAPPSTPKLPARRPSTSNPPASVAKPVNPVIKCTRCDFQCKSRVLMNQHEKTVHLRRRFFRCLQCGYVTNERGRYTKHVKYHSLPKVKCEECDFYTTYKWNLDRHMKSHEMDGPYKCTRCSFSANNRQSLSFHLAKHHDGGNPDQTEQEEEEEIDPMMEDHELEPGSNDEFEEEEQDEVLDDEDQEISNENSLEDFLGSDSHLTCRFCSFKTYSKSTLNTHEESHGSSKRYPCPLCGVSFDHVAWLAKHLTQKHGEATDSKDITRARKEAKKRAQQPPHLVGESSGSGLSLNKSPPSSPPVLKMNKATKTFSILSSPKDQKLTIGPRAKKSMPKKSEAEASASDSATETPVTPKLQHSCTVCSYKSRWLSEIEKHVRVHSLERPYGCPSCKYRCKWKGDLKRHVVKYHDESLVEEVEKMKTPIPDGSVGYTTREIDKTRSEIIEEKKLKPPEKALVPARSILKPVRLRSLLTKGRDDTDSKKPSRNGPRRGYESEDTEMSVVGNESDPGDLVIDESYGATGYEPNVVYNRKREKTPPSFPPAKKMKPSEASQNDKVSDNQSPATNKKYKCTFCPFMSRTASRFHVHIVQHLNKKPFMCSTCFYRSNWEWDITKHIKIKSVRDEAHGHASMLVTDESGRKNYEKYNRFLVDAEDSGAEDEVVETIDDEDEAPKTPEDNLQPEELGYAISPDDVENIVVTPDLGNDDQVESIELDLSRYFNSLGTSAEKAPEKPYAPSSKLYYCRHCSFKNAEKKSVVGHLSVHTGTKPYQCRICGMVSNWKHVILRHVKMRHGGGLDDVKNRLNYIENNGVIELTGYPELAAITVRPAKDPPKLKKVSPLSAPKSENLFTCEMCPYTCEKLCYMHFHIKQHKPREGANVKCPYCDYWVNFKKTLNRHLKVHQEKAEELPPLQEETILPEVLFNEGENEYREGDEFDQIHAQPQRPGQKKFQCEFCPYTSDKKRHYLYHKQFHRPNKAAPFKCDYCSYWAMHSHLITQHTKKCHTENKYGLPTSFTNPVEERIPPAVEIFLPSKSILNQQAQDEVADNEIVLTEHNGKTIRMIKCRYCPMMNRRRSNVRAHEEMHSEIKHSKFPCTLCNYQCNSQGVLTSHFKLHTAEEEKQQLEAATANSIDFDFLTQVTRAPKTPPKSPAAPRRTFTYFCPSCPAMFKSRSDYQTHSSFHGSSFPFACDRCDYRARHKPHLHKHFLVHSEAYAGRREAAQPSSSVQTIPSTSESPKAADDGQPLPEDNDHSGTQMSSVNQMLLLEERETSMFLEKGFGKQTPKVNQCPNCPATFQKPSVLNFHKYLHGVNGKYYCPHCDYSVNEIKNLKTHQKLHPVKASTVRTVLKIFSCNKCPAVFTKNNRYVKHIEYHGKDNKFTCERCDFSVNLLISLVKHRGVHKKEMATEQQTTVATASSTSTSITRTVPEESVPATEAEKQADVTKPDIKEKVTYCCNRCPYFHVRRDAMMNHHKRHTANAAIHCPHCDYSTVQASFLRDHIKWHFQPQKLIKPNSFMKYSELEVWSVKNNKRLMLFKDHGEDKENERFVSPMMDDSDGEIIEVPTPVKPPALEITIDDNPDLSESALRKSKQLEVLLTNVFKPGVRKLMDSPETPAAKRPKLDDSLTEDSDTEKLVIDNEYRSKEPPILSPQRENGYISTSIIEEEVEEEYEHREYVPDDPPAPAPALVEPDKPSKISCKICPYTTDQLRTMQIHETRHQPREGAKFKCPRCNYWTSDIKSMKRHLKLHSQNKRVETTVATSANDAAGDLSKSNDVEATVATSANKAAVDLSKSSIEVDQSETKNKDEGRTAIDEQEVIDAVENMLQETHFDDKTDVTPTVDILDQERVEMDERDLANEETIGDITEKMDDEVAVKESDDLNKTTPTNLINEDDETEVAALEEDSREIDHTYAEFKGSPLVTEEPETEGGATLRPEVSSKMAEITPAVSSENSPREASGKLELEPREVSENIPVPSEKSQDETIAVPSERKLRAIVETGQLSTEISQSIPEIPVLTPAVLPEINLQEISEQKPEVSLENIPRLINELTPAGSPENSSREATKIAELPENNHREISDSLSEESSKNNHEDVSEQNSLSSEVTKASENTREESEPASESPENNPELKLAEIASTSVGITQNDLPLSPISSEDIREESVSEPEPENDIIEELSIQSPVSIEDESEPKPKSSTPSPNENLLAPSDEEEIPVKSPESNQDSQDGKARRQSPEVPQNLPASEEDILKENVPVPTPINPENPVLDDNVPDEKTETETREEVTKNKDSEKTSDDAKDPSKSLVSGSENVDAKEPESFIQTQLLKAYFSPDIDFHQEDETSSLEDDPDSSMAEDSSAEYKSSQEIETVLDEEPVESPANHEPSTSIQDSIKILSFEDLSPEAASLHAVASPSPSLANEDGPDSSVDMDNLVVHDEINEEDMDQEQDELDLSHSEIDMSDMIIHEESESEQSQVESKDESNFTQPANPRNDLNEQRVNSADQEASDILLNMASEFFSNGSASASTDNLISQGGPEEWPAEIPNKTDVLANLLMNAGVYSEEDDSNPT